MLGLLRNRPINVETDAKPLYYSHRNHTNRIVTKNSSNRSIVPYVLRDACHEIFCVFGDFSASRTQDAEVTKSLHCRKKFTVVWSSIVIHKVLVCGSPCKVDSWLPGSAVHWPANTLYWPVWEKTKYWMLWRVMNYGEVLWCKVRPQVKKIITK